jgi:enoyl-CoA hydratase/carnithine racemase
MDIAQMKSAFTETLNEVLPSAVETAVKAETTALTTKMTDVETQMTELAKQVKFGGEDSSTKELHSKTAKFFKTLVKRSPDFVEAKAAFLNETTDAEG